MMPLFVMISPLFVMTFKVASDRAQLFGPTPVGIRGAYPVDGGTFEGARLRGRVNGDGMDWITMRADNSMLIDVRMTLVTDDGAVIGMAYQGLARTTDPADWERFSRKREMLPYEALYLHTTPRFETGDPRYAWLNGTIAVSNGARTVDGGTYHVFAID